MHKTIKLLIVEDDHSQQELYDDAIEDFNDESEYTIKSTKVDKYEDAEERLKSPDFDGAIIDLNLDTSNPNEAEGNNIVNNIIKNHRFPIFIVSANLQNLDQSIRENKSSFLGFYDRNIETKDILNKISNIYRTGITQILGGKGQVEQQIGEIFWKHLSDSFETWESDPNVSEKALLRYTVAHMLEYLDIVDTENEQHRNAEFYIKPPIREHIATGDITKKDNIRYLVISPSCDITIRSNENDIPEINTETITLLPLIEIDRDSFIEKKIIKESANSSTRSNELDKIIKGLNQKYAFIPDYHNIDAAIVDFQNIKTVSFNEYTNNFERIATVSYSFIKDIQSKFSSYYARQGQPDLDKNSLLKKHKSKLSPAN